MFRRIQTGITALASLLSSFAYTSCDKHVDHDDFSLEYGPLPYYHDYCDEKPKHNFYSDLCYRVFDAYADANYPDDSHQAIGYSEVKEVGKKYKDFVSMCEKLCYHT